MASLIASGLIIYGCAASGQAPQAATPPATQQAGEATDDYPRAAARLKQPVPHGQPTGLHKLLGDLHVQTRRLPNDRELARIRSLIAASKDIDARDMQGRTALHWAARNAQPDIVQLLLAKGADVNAMADAGWTPLHYAARATNYMPQVRTRFPKVVRLLLKAGADPFADLYPGGGFSGRPIDLVSPEQWRVGRPRELDGNTNTPADLVEVLGLLWQAMEPGQRASLKAAEKAAQAFLLAVANDESDKLRAVVDQKGVVRKAELWPRATDSLRKQLQRLTHLVSGEVDRGMAAFRVEHPEGRKGYLLLVVARFPDGQWRVIDVQSGTPDGVTLKQAIQYYVGDAKFHK